jgi:hypothetical protein
MAKAKIGDMFKIYTKPSMDGAIIIRKRGVIRRSEKVKAINRKLAAAKPARACKGKPWKEFVSCLREQTARAVGGEVKVRKKGLEGYGYEEY